MKVSVHPSDDGGCGAYRMWWPAIHVASQGYADVEVVADAQIHMDVSEDGGGVRTCHGVAPIDADVLVLQRPLHKLIAEAIPFIQANGTAVVVELDDDFQDVHRDNIAWPKVQPELSAMENWRHLRSACSRADVFVCTTDALARKYGRNTETHVIPNYLPDEYEQVRPNSVWSDPWRLGWSGSITTHPNDLQVAATGVQTAVRQLGAEFHVIGTGQGVADRLGLTADEVHPAGGWVPLRHYPHAMTLPHIGMVPLDATPFNEAKSWLKGLEFAGAGVPFVASATGPYRQLRDQHGLGRVAKKPADWAKHFRALASEAVWREEAERQRAYVLDRMLIRHHAHLWAAAWLAAGAKRRAHSDRADDVSEIMGRRYNAAELNDLPGRAA